MKRKSHAATLKVQRDLVARVALNSPESDADKRVLHKVAENLDRAVKKAESPILDLPALATPAEIKFARNRRAVRMGKDVYLPSWKDDYAGIPNGLLRSALWSVAAIGHTTEVAGSSATPGITNSDQTGVVVSTQGNFRLINRGPSLGWYDRRVFAVCINHYKDERPLYDGEATSPSDEGTSWIQLSYFQFLENMRVAYSPESHSSLRKSLERLSATSFRARTRGIELQVPRLLEVSFTDSESRGDGPKASDLIFFRAHAPVASLYGLNSWSSVPNSALNAGKGLNSWLASYYSTHSKPHPVSIDTLFDISGSVCSLGVFKTRLKGALNALCKPDVPKEIRISSYEMDETTVTVILVKWS